MCYSRSALSCYVGFFFSTVFYMLFKKRDKKNCVGVCVRVCGRQPWCVLWPPSSAVLAARGRLKGRAWSW